MFDGLAGLLVVDWLFMAGLLAIGLALFFGIGMRMAAAPGALLLFMMWLAALRPEHNPFLDDHPVYGAVIIGLAVMSYGDTWASESGGAERTSFSDTRC